MYEWKNRAPYFTFTNQNTILVWNTEEGSGIITKYSVGKLPAKRTEAVISALMDKIESLTKQKTDSYVSNNNKKRRSERDLEG